MKSETCKEDLVVQDSGHISHSSWLTKACRTLRFYISEETPSHELQEQVLFTLKSHMPMWLTIKRIKTLQAAQNLFTKQYSLPGICQNLCLMLLTLR